MATVVVTDANVLINLTHVNKLSLLSTLGSYKFLIPSEVLMEISEPDQRIAVEKALAARFLVAEADQCKIILETKRYAMPFKSFEELL